MKVTKRQLRRIIAEEVENLKYDLAQKSPLPALSVAERPEEIEAHEDAWAGGENIHNQVDHAVAGGAEETTRGIEVMPITELRSIIRMALTEFRHWKHSPDFEEEEEMWNEEEMGWEEMKAARELATKSSEYQQWTEPGTGKPRRKRKKRKGKSQSWQARAGRDPRQTKLF